jgi:hypothetical protein
MKCRICGCSQFDPCINRYGETCCWALSDVCSFCLPPTPETEYILAYQLAHSLAQELPVYDSAQQAVALDLYELCVNMRGPGRGPDFIGLKS